MDRYWPAHLQDPGNALIDLFLWPGTFILKLFGAQAPGVALGGSGTAWPAFISGIVWTIVFFLCLKLVRSIFAEVVYVGRRARRLLTDKMQAATRRRQIQQPVAVPEVEFDDLDMAILNTGMTLPPGLALTAAELSGQLTRRPDQLQRRLEKLRKYGLVESALGETDGYDNYCLSRSGITLVSMWLREDRVSI